MPQKYKPVVGTGYKKYNPEAIKNPLSNLKSGMSFRKAAEKHGIHYGILYRHRKRGSNMKKTLVDKLH